MPKSKAKASSKARRDPFNDNGSKIVPGEFTGEHPASDFVVSGHSTGSATSEMDALSKQVSLDASDDHAGPRKRAKQDWEEPDRSEFERYQAETAKRREEEAEIRWNTLRNAALALVGIGGLSVAGYLAYSRYQMRKAAIPVFPPTIRRRGRPVNHSRL
jgi:hypothetical protein